jgi:uncharacterized membrane protein YfcA
MTKDQLLNQLPYKLKSNPEPGEVITFLTKRKKTYKLLRYFCVFWLIFSLFTLYLGIFVRGGTLEIVNSSMMIVAASMLLYSLKKGINEIPDKQTIKVILEEEENNS